MESQIIKSFFPASQFPTNVSILQFLSKRVNDDNQNKTLRIDCETGVSYTLRECLDLAMSLSKALQSSEIGLQKGNFVVIMLPNIAEYFSILTGIAEANMVAVLLNPEYSESEIENMLHGMPIPAVVTLPEYLHRLKGLTEKFIHIFTVGQGPDGSKNILDLVKDFEPSFGNSFQNFDSNQTAYVVFSSGTTGTPKGVELSHRNVISQVEPIGNLYSGIHADEIYYTVFPPYHVAGAMSSFLQFFLQSTLLFSSGKFSVANFTRIIKKFQPTVIALPPTVISIMCSCDELGITDFNRLKYITYGSSALGKTLAERLSAKIGSNVATVGVYGCSEFTCYCTVQPFDSARPDNTSVGKVIPHAEMKIISTTTGVNLGASEPGEICFRGPQLFKGYVNNFEAFRKTVDDDGWLHTGDYGYYDEEHNLFITGRIKDLIKVNSYQVSPDEIENVIRKIDQIEEVVVFGVPDPKTQEAPRALIIRKTEALTEQYVHDYLKSRLVHYKQLRGGIRFVKSIPVTKGTRKINRREARSLDEDIERGCFVE